MERVEAEDELTERLGCKPLRVHHPTASDQASKGRSPLSSNKQRGEGAGGRRPALHRPPRGLLSRTSPTAGRRGRRPRRAASRCTGSRGPRLRCPYTRREWRAGADGAGARSAQRGRRRGRSMTTTTTMTKGGRSIGHEHESAGPPRTPRTSFMSLTSTRRSSSPRPGLAKFAASGIFTATASPVARCVARNTRPNLPLRLPGERGRTAERIQGRQAAGRRRGSRRARDRRARGR